MVTVDEIRKIVQRPARAHRYYIIFLGPLLEKISPYFTKFFIEHGVSANQVSCLVMLSGTIGSTLFILGNVYIMLAGWIFYVLYALLDNVDGEIARTTNTETVTGIFLEDIGGSVVLSSFFICFGLGLYNLYGNIFFILCGLSFTLAIWIVRSLRASIEWMMMKCSTRARMERTCPPLKKRKTFAGKLYRKYLLVNMLFSVFNPGFLCIPVFEILLPVSYTICGVTLTILSTYFLLYGFDWIARAVYTTIRTYRVSLLELHD